jgi:uncharacterized protein (TIGR02598 family)
MKFSRSQGGFSLVEVTMALGITAFCVVSLFGLLAVGVQSNSAAVEQTGANAILSAVIADLRATPATIPRGAATVSARFQIPIPANPVTEAPPETTLYFNEQGNPNTSLQPDSRYRLTIDFPPNGNAPRTATFARLRLTWPAQVDPSKAAGEAVSFTLVDRN